jgi:enoyl-CoA hydratase/carnithine racemase
VSLNRPERRNAIDGRLLEGLLGAFAEPNAQAVVLCSCSEALALERQGNLGWNGELESAASGVRA